jgi:ankyrin repeat protein
MIDMLIAHGAVPGNALNDAMNAYAWSSFGGYKAQDVAALLDRGANVDTRDRVHGTTLLMSVAGAGKTDIAKVLLDHGANVHLQDTRGDTALHKGSLHASMIALLLEHGAAVDVTNAQGRTPLYHATMNSNHDGVRLLIDNGADVTAACMQQTTPLHWAAGNGSRPAFCGKAEMESPVIHGSRLHYAAVFSLGSGVDDLRPTTQITPTVNLTKAELTHRDQAEQQRQRRLFVAE